jgi:CBS domain containing-hemolysin-like protein
MKSVKKILRDILIKGGLLRTTLSEDELKQVIDASSLSGTIDKTEHELIKSVLQF